MRDSPALSHEITFSQYLELYGGPAGARDLIIDHMARHHALHVNEDEADTLLEDFRQVGVAQDLSLGEYLDGIALGEEGIPASGEQMECPHCGVPQDSDAVECRKCHQPLTL